MVRAVLILLIFFFFNDTATTEIYTLSLHDALPICWRRAGAADDLLARAPGRGARRRAAYGPAASRRLELRSEEHTSELQSQSNLVCRLLLEKKKNFNSSTGLINTRSVDMINLLFRI